MSFDLPTMAVILSAVSFVAGFIDSIAGGGGLLLLPALLFTGLPPQTVLGTNKFASTFGTSFALVNFVRSKKVDWRIVAVGIAFTLLGAFLGTKAILYFPNDQVGRIIVFLLPFAMAITLIPRKVRSEQKELTTQELWKKVPLICFTIGFYDGFLGPGTGSFLIMAFYIWLGLDLVMASGTAKVFNLGSNIGALVVFLMEGKVLYLLGLPMALANIAGNLLGSTLAIRKGTNLVRAFLMTSFGLLFITLVWKYFF
ncbi:TSUP family transporter [Heliobacterium chlorum]|uniref:Probable membrane transporter protein n=1 Tax=Heliobacterium chlorum TaxID=2698 RepID=A0ABR7T696_HELCL|nr:TSUP family transporter [Heliobacterium chlorum]MBC9785186.1 TSUP family transporter [Heliobacterium chlorum]